MNKIIIDKHGWVHVKLIDGQEWGLGDLGVDVVIEQEK